MLQKKQPRAWRCQEFLQVSNLSITMYAQMSPHPLVGNAQNFLKRAPISTFPDYSTAGVRPSICKHTSKRSVIQPRGGAPNTYHRTFARRASRPSALSRLSAAFSFCCSSATAHPPPTLHPTRRRPSTTRPCSGTPPPPFFATSRNPAGCSASNKSPTATPASPPRDGKGGTIALAVVIAAPAAAGCAAKVGQRSCYGLLDEGKRSGCSRERVGTRTYAYRHEYRYINGLQAHTYITKNSTSASKR